MLASMLRRSSLFLVLITGCAVSRGGTQVGVEGETPPASNVAPPEEPTEEEPGEGPGDDPGNGGSPGTPGACDLPRPQGWRLAPHSTTADVERRVEHAAVWTGREMLVFGGRNNAVKSGALASGGAYDPMTDRWRRIADAPHARNGHRAVWTGTKMLVFGGWDHWSWPPPHRNDGLAYDYATDTWSMIPAAPLEARGNATVVWSTTTGEMIVWGGGTAGDTVDDPDQRFGDGAAYDPYTNTWRRIADGPLSPRAGHAAVWTGDRMIVFGGNAGEEPLGDAAAYDPTSDTWTKIEVPSWLGPRNAPIGLATMLSSASFFGGHPERCAEDCAIANDGGTWNEATKTWSKIAALESSVLPFPARSARTFWWGAGKLYLWGGRDHEVWDQHADGASWDPSTNTWTKMPDAPFATHNAKAVWTGCEAVVYGGDFNGSARTAVFRP